MVVVREPRRCCASVRRDLRARLALLARRVPLVRPVLRVLPVLLARRVPLVQLVLQVHRGRRVRPVPQDRQGLDGWASLRR